MSEYQIPFHIQEEILKRLPVKSLIHFRSVSKSWKSLIDSSDFIAAHSRNHHTQQQHLLVSYEDPEGNKNHVCYIDDDTFPQKRSLPTLPLSIKQLSFPRVIGSSHGLLCLYGSDPNLKTKMVVLWNPSIRKSIVIVVTDNVLEIYDDDDDDDNYEAPKLVVYEANSEHNNVLEISGSTCFFTVNSYMETLLLLGLSDCNSY